MNPLLPGLYALTVVVATEAQLPFIGKAEVRTESLALAELTETPTGWTQTQTVCRVDVHESQRMSQTIIPPAFVSAIPARTNAVSFAPTEAGWAYSVAGTPEDVGWNPALGGFPATAADPGVVDFEQDGHPGATVYLRIPLFGNVEIYVAQRAQSEMVGVVADGGVSGSVAVTDLRSATLGASSRFFARTVPVRFVPEHSTFALVPVPAGSTCANLTALAQRDG